MRPLLTTKLYIPPVRPKLVSRPRLIQRLNAGLQSGRKLTLISAPAGFGKTTLASEWVHQGETPVAWVSLDEGDNDPVRFLSYVIAALETLHAGLGESVLPLLHSFQALPATPVSAGGAERMEGVLTALINAIVAAPADPATGPGFALILDDYHVIEAQAVHDALTFILDHRPPRMHLVIASRTAPPLALARLRVQGQLTDLRADDLRFRPDETAAFLNEVMGLHLSDEDVALLEARTEGWIAGLQMAALSMQERDDVAGFIAAFAGRHRYVLDYLTEEVLHQQPQVIQTFLLQTSILDQLTGPLCDEVTGRDDGREILERLEHANRFIIPLDDERRWYRYHHLFGDFMRARLRQAQAELWPTLHHRAAAWYEERGLTAKAIDHALEAGDFEWAARLIEGAAEMALTRSQVSTFQDWVEALPDEVVRARPNLCLFHAWALLLTGRSLDSVESRLQEAEDDAVSVPGRVKALRSLIAAFQGHASGATELSRQALERLPQGDPFLRSIVALNLSIPVTLSGDIRAALGAWREAAQIAQQAGNILAAVIATCLQAELHITQGQLYRAQAVYQRALELAAGERGQPLPIGGVALMGLGELSRQWNDLETATRLLTEGIELTREWGEIVAFDGYIALARVKQAQGDMHGARDILQHASRLAIQFDVSELDDLLVDGYRVRLWVAEGDVAKAARLVEEHGPDSDLAYHLREFEHITLARVRLAQDRPDEALGLLTLLLSEAEKLDRIGSVIEILTLCALAHQAQGQTDQATTTLERALSLAEPEGYVRTFVDEGEPMARLLSQIRQERRKGQLAAARGAAPGYATRLLAAYEVRTKDDGPKTKEALSSSVPRHPKESLIEPLGERELEILRLIATGLSNREIAAELILAVSTVKWYVNSLYGKLGVHSRTQAVARARELELL